MDIKGNHQIKEILASLVVQLVVAKCHPYKIMWVQNRKHINTYIWIFVHLCRLQHSYTRSMPMHCVPSLYHQINFAFYSVQCNTYTPLLHQIHLALFFVSFSLLLLLLSLKTTGAIVCLSYYYFTSQCFHSPLGFFVVFRCMHFGNRVKWNRD